MKFNLHILKLDYLEEKLSYFQKVIKDKDKDKKEQDNRSQVFNSKKEKKNKKNI